MKSIIKKKSSRKKAAKVESRLYEAMFLVDSADAASDWEGVNSAIKSILEKRGVEIVSIRKWDDRRFAYEINGKEKGAYILCYFKAEGKKIQNIERDVQLSEQIMRVLILCAERQGIENIEEVSVQQKESEAKTKEDAPAEQPEEGEQKNNAEQEADDQPSEA